MSALDLPEGVAVKYAMITAYAKSAEDYRRIAKMAHEQGIRVSEQDSHVSWEDTETSVRWMVMRPDPVMEEDLNSEALSARYNKGRR